MEYISISQDSPIEGRRVLCYCSSGYVAVGYLLEGEWEMEGNGRSFKSRGYTVTHFAFLPEPPENQ